MKEIKKCSICDSTTKVCNTEIGLLCGKHYLQYKRYGEIQSRTKYDSNEFVIEGDLVRIFLYNKEGNKVAEALVDKDDYNLIKDYKWCLDKNGYVKNSKQEYLHRVITRETALYVDHINGNKLDNHLSNLKWGTNLENSADMRVHGTNVNANKTHCRAGHEFNDANTRINPRGQRVCRTCDAANARRYRRSKTLM